MTSWLAIRYARVCAFDKVGSKETDHKHRSPATVAPHDEDRQQSNQSKVKSKPIVVERPFAERARKYLIDGVSVSLYQAINKFNKALLYHLRTC